MLGIMENEPHLVDYNFLTINLSLFHFYTCRALFIPLLSWLFRYLMLYLQKMEFVMTNNPINVSLLESRGIRPTSSRLLILRQLTGSDEALSMADIERLLPTMDKSTISRTLSLFLLHRLVHAVDDGSGSLKYALSGNTDEESFDDEHTHFACERCHRTFCLKQVHVPIVPLPNGFQLHSISYVLKGLCPECAEK